MTSPIILFNIALLFISHPLEPLEMLFTMKLVLLSFSFRLVWFHFCLTKRLNDVYGLHTRLPKCTSQPSQKCTGI